MKCMYFTVYGNEDCREGITTILFHDDSAELPGLVENSTNDQVHWCCANADILTIFVESANNKDSFRMYMYCNEYCEVELRIKDEEYYLKSSNTTILL